MKVGRFVKLFLSCVAGVLLGVILVLFVVYLYPYSHQSRTERVLGGFENNESTESFFLDIPADLIAATHGGMFPFQSFPPGIPGLDAPNLESGFALITEIRNREGAVIGFGTELETASPESSFLKGRIMTDTFWSLIIPGRGSVHLYQTENNWNLTKNVALPARLTGKPWSGNWVNVNTLGPLPSGRGIIVGGSGEFEGITGTFVEVGTLQGLSPEGALKGAMELRLSPSRQAP